MRDEGRCPLSTVSRTKTVVRCEMVDVGTCAAASLSDGKRMAHVPLQIP